MSLMFLTVTNESSRIGTSPCVLNSIQPELVTLHVVLFAELLPENLHASRNIPKCRLG